MSTELVCVCVCVCGAVGALQRATCIQMHRADRDWTASRIDFLPDNLPLSLTHLVRYLHIQDVSRELCLKKN